jgi:TolB-like protein/Tfp pilus assembly protein PilF
LEEKRATPANDKHHIAVLPMVNISPDARDEYFADGMTEELISTLSRIRHFKVIARTSVMRYKNVDKTIAEIGRELKVGTILEGSVRKVDNKLRITAKLVDVHAQEPLWSRDYDREFKDVFAIQSEIAQRVVETLQAQLLAGEKQSLANPATANLEAYTLYLQGRFFWNKRMPAAIIKSIEYFERAILQDSSYALAYAGLADAYATLGSFEYGVLLPRQAIPKAEAATLKALAIDSRLAEARTALANIRFNYWWDFSGAEKEYQLALELNPSYALAHHWYAHYLAAMGRLEEALIEEKRAQEVDPLSLIINTQVGVVLYYARRYDEAIAQCRRTLKMDSSFVQALLTLSASYMQKSRYGEAIAVLQKAFLFSEGHPSAAALLAHAYAVSGHRSEAMKMLHELRRSMRRQQISPLHLALIYLGLGDKEQVFAWLEKAYEERSSYLAYLNVEPLADSLRSELRFLGLLKKIGLRP